MTRTTMIHGVVTPDLANYARDEGDWVSRDDSEEMHLNSTPCPVVESTPIPEREVWSETVEFLNHEDATPISSTPCRSNVRNSTEVAIAASYSSPSISVTPIHKENIVAERAQILDDEIVVLAINNSEARGSLDHLLSADTPVSSLDLPGPITVRDLPNATPRPTPSPEPESMSSLGNPIDAASKEALSSTMTARYADSDGSIPSLEELDLGNDFLPYNVEAEPLPPGPFADRDYQNAVKAGKDLAKSVADQLGICTRASQDSTQLHKIQERAKELQRFDSPATRTIAMIGDSAAGKSQPSRDTDIWLTDLCRQE